MVDPEGTTLWLRKEPRNEERERERVRGILFLFLFLFLVSIPSLHLPLHIHQFLLTAIYMKRTVTEFTYNRA